MVFWKNRSHGQTWEHNRVISFKLVKSRVTSSHRLHLRRVSGARDIVALEDKLHQSDRTKLNSCRDHRSSGVLERRMMQTSEMRHLQDLPEECCKVGQPSADGEQEEAKDRGHGRAWLQILADIHAAQPRAPQPRRCTGNYRLDDETPQGGSLSTILPRLSLVSK